MLDRRGFLAAMLGVAVAPKDVLAGLATPAPVKKAVGEWVCTWKELGPATLTGGAWTQAFSLEINYTGDLSTVFKTLDPKQSEELMRRFTAPPVMVKTAIRKAELKDASEKR